MSTSNDRNQQQTTGASYGQQTSAKTKGGKGQQKGQPHQHGDKGQGGKGGCGTC